MPNRQAAPFVIIAEVALVLQSLWHLSLPWRWEYRIEDLVWGVGGLAIAIGLLVGLVRRDSWSRPATAIYFAACSVGYVILCGIDIHDCNYLAFDSFPSLVVESTHWVLGSLTCPVIAYRIALGRPERSAIPSPRSQAPWIAIAIFLSLAAVLMFASYRRAAHVARRMLKPEELRLGIWRPQFRLFTLNHDEGVRFHPSWAVFFEPIDVWTDPRRLQISLFGTYERSDVPDLLEKLEERRGSNKIRISSDCEVVGD